MADEKVKAEVSKSAADEKDWKHPGKPAFGFVLLVLVFLALLCTAFMFGKQAADRFDRDDRFGGQMMTQRQSGGYSARGGMMDDGFGRGMRGGASSDTNSASSTRVMGVVTVVDGDVITVAGNGTTTKVTVNDNTTYTGDDKPAKVNDTIMAVGARDSSDNLVAATVRLSRQ